MVSEEHPALVAACSMVVTSNELGGLSGFDGGKTDEVIEQVRFCRVVEEHASHDRHALGYPPVQDQRHHR